MTDDSVTPGELIEAEGHDSLAAHLVFSANTNEAKNQLEELIALLPESSALEKLREAHENIEDARETWDDEIE